MKRAVLLAMLAPAVASAHSDRALFDDPAIAGGAGGRYFTGSRLDGYACNVCHTGATTDDFTIEALPDKLEAGRRYDVVIRDLASGAEAQLVPNASQPAFSRDRRLRTCGRNPRDSGRG